MATLKAFQNTKIDVFKTQGALEDLLAKRGIKASRWTHYGELGPEPGIVRFEFEWQRQADSPPLAFKIEVAYKGKLGPYGGQQGTTREQASRALFWHVKNLFDAVDFGIVDMQAAFMPYLLLPSGETTYERAEMFFKALESGQSAPLLSEGRTRPARDD